jgi:hypothetical protein
LIHRRAAALVLALTGAGCITGGAAERDDVTASRADEWAPFPRRTAPREEWARWPGDGFVGYLVAERASHLVGLKSLKGLFPRLPDDCTGLVRAAWAETGVNLLAAALRGDNGVTAMYRLAEGRGALKRDAPEPGDLVFFRETYDRNHDGLFNDGLTHVAVVESVDVDGTVTYVHRASTGVTRARLNLAAPDLRTSLEGSVLNDYLRPRSRLSPAVLSGELFAGYASARLLAAGP